MADVKPFPSALLLSDQPHAPILFIDSAPIFSTYNGIVAVTLAAMVQPGVRDQQINTREKVVAYLRMNVEAARLLRDTLDKALLAAMPAKPEAN